MNPITNTWLWEQVKKEEARRRDYEESHKKEFKRIEESIEDGELFFQDIEKQISYQCKVNSLRGRGNFTIRGAFRCSNLKFPEVDINDNTASAHRQEFIERTFEKYHLAKLKSMFPAMLEYSLSCGTNHYTISSINVILQYPTEPDLLDVSNPCPFGLDSKSS